MVTAKVNAPNYQAYEPTDLEKVFAQQMFANPDLGGTAWAMLMHGGADRAAGIDRYTADLAGSNRMQQLLAEQEMKAQLTETALKEAAGLSNAGIPLDKLPVVSQLFTGGAQDDQTREASLINILKKRAEIAKLGAEASNVGGDKYEVGVTYDPATEVMVPTYKGKGKDLSQLQETVMGGLPRNPGATPPPGSVPTVPGAGGRNLTPQQQRQRDAQQRARGQHTVPGTQYGQ